MGAAIASGYVYRTLYPTAQLVCSFAEEVGVFGLPQFTSAVVNDPLLARLLSRYHDSVETFASVLEQETRSRHALIVILCNHMNAQAPRLETTVALREVAQARDYLSEDLAPDVSWALLATVVGMSPFHLACAVP